MTTPKTDETMRALASVMDDETLADRVERCGRGDFSPSEREAFCSEAAARLRRMSEGDNAR